MIIFAFEALQMFSVCVLVWGLGFCILLLTQTVKVFGAESMCPFGERLFGICSIVKPVTRINVFSFNTGIKRISIIRLGTNKKQIPRNPGNPWKAQHFPGWTVGEMAVRGVLVGYQSGTPNIDIWADFE